MPLGNPNPEAEVAVLGAGPAGLTAGHALAGRGRRPVVFEADTVVGGIARTVVRDGYRFDLGGHRFFTKSEEVGELWRRLLGDELLLRPRLSRIYWNGRFVDYPLRVGNLVARIGPRELARSGGSYLAAALRPTRKAPDLEAWVTQRFGRRLYELFFRTYTEKVWGVPCSEIRSEWAAQRIRELSLGRAVAAALPGVGGGGIRTLIDEFHYPRLGPGQMWETMASEIVDRGGTLNLGAPVTRIALGGNRVGEVTAGGRTIATDAVISSLPLSTIAAVVDPKPPDEVRTAASGLRYRDFLTVALVLRGRDPFPDNWVYVHDPGVRVGRIQNFRAWSPALVPDRDRACVGMEYFCFRGDELWRMDDDALVELAADELAAVGLAERSRVERGYVERVPRAYPIYDESYADRLAVIRAWLDGIENLQQIGRNGLHRYNNSDHSMLTALRAVENLLDGAGHEIWDVNADGAYVEEDATVEHPYRSAPAPSAAAAPGQANA